MRLVLRVCSDTLPKSSDAAVSVLFHQVSIIVTYPFIAVSASAFQPRLLWCIATFFLDMDLVKIIVSKDTGNL
jgi:hypothetical protein